MFREEIRLYWVRRLTWDVKWQKRGKNTSWVRCAVYGISVSFPPQFTLLIAVTVIRESPHPPPCYNPPLKPSEPRSRRRCLTLKVLECPGERGQRLPGPSPFEVHDRAGEKKALLPEMLRAFQSHRNQFKAAHKVSRTSEEGFQKYSLLV